MEELSNSDPDGLVPSSLYFTTLDECIEEVKSLIERLADPVLQGEFTDGSIRHELHRLKAVRQGILNCITWSQRRNEFAAMLQYLKEGCEHLNTAASTYKKTKQRNHHFYSRIGKGQELLEQMVDAWNDLQSS